MHKLYKGWSTLGYYANQLRRDDSLVCKINKKSASGGGQSCTHVELCVGALTYKNNSLHYTLRLYLV